MKISAIIPAYNAEKTVGRAIESVLGQTRPADEIIIIDDGSTDNTAEIVRSFGDKVKLIQQENTGVSVARNRGIEAATGNWIAFLDADDEWLPDKLKLQADHLTRHPDLKWTFSNFYRKELDKEQMHLALPSVQSLEIWDNETFLDYLDAYCRAVYAWTSVLVIHQDLFKTVGMFEPGMKRAQDNDLWYRIAYQFPQIGYLPESLSIYHLDTPSSSTKINDDVDFMVNLVTRHEKLSKEYGRYDAFRPCLTHMIQIWIRSLVRQHRTDDARLLLTRFDDYLSKRFLREIHFRMSVPIFGSALVDAVFWLKKKIKSR